MIDATRFGLATLAIAAALVALSTFAPAAGRAARLARPRSRAGRTSRRWGALLDTVADDRGTITLNGAPVTGTADSTKPTTEDCTPGAQGVGCTNYASYAVFNRQTLQLVASGSLAPNIPGTQDLLKLADTYDKAPTYLMVVNVQGLNGHPADGKKLLSGSALPQRASATLRRRLSRIRSRSSAFRVRRRVPRSSRTISSNASAPRRGTWRTCPAICG